MKKDNQKFLRVNEPEKYTVTSGRIAGSSYGEIEEQALITFHKIKKRTKRTPYIRSKIFNRQKVFLNLFWSHLHQKHEKERLKRLRFYNCAIELIENTTKPPTTKDNPNNRFESLHRFAGVTKNKEEFYVQIKENKRTNRKDLISIFTKS